MAKTESDRKNEKTTKNPEVAPLGTDTKKRKKPEEGPYEEFIDPKPNRTKTNKPGQ
jgi:hypothetical protein